MQQRPARVVLRPALVGSSEGDLGRVNRRVAVAQDAECQPVEVLGMLAVGAVNRRGSFPIFDHN